MPLAEKSTHCFNFSGGPMKKQGDVARSIMHIKNKRKQKQTPRDGT